MKNVAWFLLIERMEYPTRRAKQRGIYSKRQWLPTDHNHDVWIHRIFFVVVYVWSVMRLMDYGMPTRIRPAVIRTR